jgi:hypothetical protein
MAQAVSIPRSDMVDFLSPLGFEEVIIPGTNEMVMEKTLGRKALCWTVVVRVYTSVVGNASRGVGKDAIRVVPLLKLHPKRAQTWGLRAEYPLGKDRRVHRVVNWRKNLADRLGRAEQAQVKTSPQGFPMVVRKARGRGGSHFWGSLGYPQERYTRPYTGGA